MAWELVSENWERIQQLLENYPACKEAYNAGYSAGYDEEEVNNPYPVKSNENRCWKMGYGDGAWDC